MINAKVTSFPDLYTKRSNQKALQFWRVMDSLKIWKTSKGAFWYPSARPRTFARFAQWLFRPCKDPVLCFLDVDKPCADVFGILPRFLENLLESEHLVFGARTRTRTILGILQRCFNHFAASFFKQLGIHFSQEAKESHVPVVNAFSLVPFLCMGMITPVFQCCIQKCL